MTRQRGWSGITVTDQFCGAGGSTIGAKRAGLEVRLAMNHWARAVETYNTNNPDTECHHADVSAQDPRRFPSTDLLITSPECTTHSPAGGNRRSKPQPDLFVPHVDDPAMVRSRATMWDVPRFAEYHEYNLIIVENVVEVTRWPLFHTWLQAMLVLGYHHKIVSHNSMHSHPTPQSRDRVYIAFWKKGNRAPDFDIRPKAPCPKCERVVDARQTWKNGRTVGKYKTQYIFTCPDCRTTVVPFYYAALNAIDFSLAAERIGDRVRPLKERTLERIRYGLEKYGNRHLLVRTVHGERMMCRVRGADDPFGTQPATSITGLVSPFVVACANDGPAGPRVKGLDETVNAIQAGGNNHALVSPFLVDVAFQAERSRGVIDPMFSQTARQSVALVSPAFLAVLRTHNRAKPLDAPMDAICTGGGHHMLTVPPFITPIQGAAGRARGFDDALPAQMAECGHDWIVQGAAQISMRDANAMRVAGLDGELMAQGCGPQQAIVGRVPFIVSYYSGGGQDSPADESMPTQDTRDRHGVVSPAINVDDCYFRMLQPHEIGAAMAFPTDYVVTGNKHDRVKQYGNAVTPPVMDELVRRAVASLAPEVAA